MTVLTNARNYTLCAAALLLALATLAQAQAPVVAEAEFTPIWSRDATRLLSTLPLQDGGRVKPLSTFADFRLLKLNGMRRLKLPSGDRATATAWLADCLFNPERAQTYKMFRVDNSDVLVALDLAFQRKRDRYSYRDLMPAMNTLFSLASQYSALEEVERTIEQRQLVNLAHNLREFQALLGEFEFARTRFAAEEVAPFRDLLPGKEAYRVSDLLRIAPALLDGLRAAPPGHAAPGAEPAPTDPRADAAHSLVRTLDTVAALSSLALFPPEDNADPVWLSPGDVIASAFAAEGPDARQIERIADLEALYDLRDNPASFEPRLAELHRRVTDATAARDDRGKVALEAAYYRARLLDISQALFVVGFILVSVLMLRPSSRWLSTVAMTSVALAATTLCAAITWRCIIRDRPPVTNLYETILFITAVIVVIALALEAVHRHAVGLVMGTVLGSIGLFLASRYEAVEGTDTMPSMVAVLDTNFWLATHVTTITIGYAAGLLAGALGHVYVFARLFRVKLTDERFLPGLTGMTYGVFRFSLVFSIVGTVLGGIWANESWGRFWGWDPKENGALLIVLWQLAVVHARSGRYIQDFGVNMAAIFGGVVVAYSWFGVNLLGVGLHSYGFTTGVARALTAFYIIETSVLLIGSAVWTWEEGLRMTSTTRT